MSSLCSMGHKASDRRARTALPSLCPSFFVAVLLASSLTPDLAIASDLKVANAWISVPAAYENPSAYFVIQNHDKKIRTIVGGQCAGCDWIEIRRVVFKDGVMGSEKMDEIQIPAGGAVAFVPRGLFMSLIGLSSVEVGANLPIELEFKNGDRLEIEATVRKP